jgi:hypothetical protein
LQYSVFVKDLDRAYSRLSQIMRTDAVDLNNGVRSAVSTSETRKYRVPCPSADTFSRPRSAPVHPLSGVCLDMHRLERLQVEVVAHASEASHEYDARGGTADVRPAGHIPEGSTRCRFAKAGFVRPREGCARQRQDRLASYPHTCLISEYE